MEALVRCDELDSASAMVEELHAASLTSGSTIAEITALGGRSWIHTVRGDLAAAESELSTVLTLAQESGILMGVTSVLFMVVDVFVERDGMAHIIDLVEQVELGQDFLETASGGMLLEARGRLRLARRDAERGIADLRAAGRIFSALGFTVSYSAWRSALAIALPPRDRDEAVALATEELELARSVGLPRPEAVALRALGILDGSQRGIELLRESVALLEDSQARLEYARSLIELGAALRRANRRAEARPHLVAGMRLAARMRG